LRGARVRIFFSRAGFGRLFAVSRYEAEADVAALIEIFDGEGRRLRPFDSRLREPDLMIAGWGDALVVTSGNRPDTDDQATEFVKVYGVPPWDPKASADFCGATQ